MKVAKGAVKEKPEVTEDKLRLLQQTFHSGSRRHAGKGYAAWMTIVYETMANTGCRFSESRLKVKEDINFENNTIRRVDAKRKDGDAKKFFTFPMFPQLQGGAVAVA